MIPLVDIHCHLLAGLDDGPRTDEDALAMCRMACAEGIALASATAHQNERWPAVTPERIRQGTAKLSSMLRKSDIGLTVTPCAEVMAHPGIEQSWRNGNLLSVADKSQHLLVEMPDGLFVDLRDSVRELRRDGIRPILAHPERHPELLHDPGRIEELIRLGCLVQVSSSSITEPATRQDARALKRWLKRGVVHVLGSDGHSPTRRPPKMAEAYRQISRWAGPSLADRVCSTNGMAILQGLQVRVTQPEPARKEWFGAFWR